MLKRVGKFILAPSLIVLIVMGGAGGITLADEDTSQAESVSGTTFQEMVAEYLGISVGELQDALDEARDNVQDIVDPEARREALNEEIDRILHEWYGTSEGAWADAIEAARGEMQDEIKTRKVEMQAQRTELQAQLVARRGEIQEQLTNRKIEMQTRIEARRAEMQARIEARKAE